MRGGANGSDSSQMPGDADVVVRALLVELRGSHQLERLAPEYPFAARRATVAEVKSRVGQQVFDTDADAAGGDARRGRERALERRRIVRAVQVTDGETIGDEVAGGRAGVREPEWLEDQVADRRVDRGAGDGFDDAPGDAEAGVVVTPRGARGRELHQAAERRHEVLERLLAAIRPGDLPFPSARVSQEMPDRHLTADSLVLHAEIGQVRADGGPQIDLALLDEAHQRRGGKRLRDRGDRKHRVRGNRQRVLDAGHTETSHRRHAVGHDPERDSGNAVSRILSWTRAASGSKRASPAGGLRETRHRGRHRPVSPKHRRCEGGHQNGDSEEWSHRRRAQTCPAEAPRRCGAKADRADYTGDSASTVSIQARLQTVRLAT